MFRTKFIVFKESFKMTPHKNICFDLPKKVASKTNYDKEEPRKPEKNLSYLALTKSFISRGKRIISINLWGR